VGEQGDSFLLSAACMALVLSNEVLEEADVVPTLVCCAVCIDDLCIDGTLIIVGQVTSKLPMRLVMIFLDLPPLINHSCPVEFHCCDHVLQLIFLVDDQHSVLLFG
jgi:hypothetical protein